MTFCVDVITADSSKLKNRGLAYAFTSSPYIITAFAGPKASESFLEHINWRWGFGCFAIIFPVVAAPLFFVLKFNLRKAKKEGVLAEEGSGRTWLQSIQHYAVDFDREFALVQIFCGPSADLPYKQSSVCSCSHPVSPSSSFRSLWRPTRLTGGVPTISLP